MPGLFEKYGVKRESEGLFDKYPEVSRETPEEDREGWLERFLRSAGAYVARTPQHLAEMADVASYAGGLLADPLRLNEERRRREALQLREWAEDISEPLAQRIGPKTAPETFSEKAAEGLGAFGPQLLEMLGGGGAAKLAMRGAKGAKRVGRALTAGGLVGGGSLREAEERIAAGEDFQLPGALGNLPQEDQVRLKALLSAGGGAILEPLGLKFLGGMFSRVPRNEGLAVAKQLLIGAGGEGLTEATQELYEAAIEASTGKRFEEDELKERVGLAGTVGLVGAGGLSVPAAGVHLKRRLTEDAEPTGPRRKDGIFSKLGIEMDPRVALTVSRGMGMENLRIAEEQASQLQAEVFEARGEQKATEAATRDYLAQNPDVNPEVLSSDLRVYLQSPETRAALGRALPIDEEILVNPGREDSGEPSLWREASAQNIAALVDPSIDSDVPFGSPQTYVATTPDLALGQRDNASGIFVEIDPAGLDVRRPQRGKPGSDLVEGAGGGGERTILSQPSSIKTNVRSVRIPNRARDAYAIRLRNMFKREGWEVGPDGEDTVFRRPVAEPINAEVVEREAVARLQRVSPELLDTMDAKRRRIDKWTDRLINSGYLTDSQVEALEENRGRYTARQYRIFENEVMARDWANEMPSEVWNAAVQWQMKEDSFLERYGELEGKKLEQAAEAELSTRLRTLEQQQETDKPSNMGPLGVVNRDPFRHREDLPKEVRDFLGEYTDEAIVFQKTIERMATSYHKARMYDAVLDAGWGTAFVTEPSSDQDMVDLRKLSETSKTAEELMRVVSGPKQLSPTNPRRAIGANDPVYAPLSLINAMDLGSESVMRALADTRNPIGQLFWRFAQASGATKLTLTAMRPQSQLRNFVWSNPLDFIGSGNLFFPGMYGKGEEGPSALRQAQAIADVPVLNKIFGEPDQAARDAAALALRLGFTPRSVELGELESFFGNMDEALRQYEGRELTAGEQVGKAAKATANVATQMYQFGDNVWKIAMGTREMQALRWQYAKELEAGTVTEADIQKQAAEFVKQMAQNYDRLPRLIQAWRTLPVAGPFVAFPVASALNFKNIAQTGFRELVTGKDELIDAPANIRTRVRGAHRLGSLGAVLGGGVKAMSAIAHYLAQHAIDMVDVDDEEQEEYDAIGAVPFWSRDSQIKILGRDEKDPSRVYYLDSSFMDYFGALSRPFIAGMRAGRFDENAWAEAIKSATEPLWAPDVLTGAVLETLFNDENLSRSMFVEGEKKRPIRRPGDTWTEWVENTASHMLLSTVGPLQVAKRLMKAGGMLGENPYATGSDIAWQSEWFAQFVGPRVSVIDYGENLRRQANVTQAITGESGNAAFRDKLLTPGTKQDAELAVRTLFELTSKQFSRLSEAHGAALRHGITPKAAASYLQASKLPKRELEGLIGGANPEQMAARYVLEAARRLQTARRERFQQAVERYARRRPTPPPYEIQEEKRRLAQQWAPLDFSFLRQYLQEQQGAPR